MTYSETLAFLAPSLVALTAAIVAYLKSREAANIAAAAKSIAEAANYTALSAHEMAFQKTTNGK